MSSRCRRSWWPRRSRSPRWSSSGAPTKAPIMRGVRWLTGAWRGASFSLKFAAVILVAGVAVAIVPFLLAEATSRSQAENSAADKVDVAYNLIQGQRESLHAFVAGVSRQVAAEHALETPASLRTSLEADGAVLAPADILGVVQGDGTGTAVQGSRPLTGVDPITRVLVNAVDSHARTAATPDGSARLVEDSPLPGIPATTFVARPVSASFKIGRA